MKVNQLELMMINLQVHTFMMPLENPLKRATGLVTIARKRTPLIFVDLRGEMTSEKQAMSQFLDDQISAAAGTHTYVQTNDARILSKGAAFLSDVGMTGPYGGISGMKCEPIIGRSMITSSKRFEVVETGRTTLSTCILEIGDQTDQAKMAEPIQISEDRSSRE